MKLLNLDARLSCDHRAGIVALKAQQTFVCIDGRPVLTAPDPVGCSIAGCPNVGLNIKPCTSTLAVSSGYSTFIRIAGNAVVLDTVSGLTNGTPPSSVTYQARHPGQSFVSEL